MSRKSRNRHRVRKARRHAQRAEDKEYREQGLVLPRNGNEGETRDPRLRWQNLSARGGLRLGFVPTGITVPVDYDVPDEAEAALRVAAAVLLQATKGEA